MSIGKKFLDRVLTEAKKDVDGFKDNFDINTLSPTSPAMANLPLPMARQVVQLYHLLGVSAETLEMRPKAVKEAAMEMADQMRTNRPLRVAAQRLFAALATAKGFARKEEEVMEASASMTPEKDMQLMGNTVVKQMEAVLAALKLPAGVLQRAMRRDQGSMMDTAAMLRTGAPRSKFAMLASELGVDLMNIGSKVKVEESVEDKVDALLALFEADEAMQPQDTQPTQGAGGEVQKNSGLQAFHDAAAELVKELGLDVANLPNAKMLDRKMMIAQRGDAFNTRAIRLMRVLTALLKGNNR